MLLLEVPELIERILDKLNDVLPESEEISKSFPFQTVEEKKLLDYAHVSEPKDVVGKVQEESSSKRKSLKSLQYDRLLRRTL